MIMKKTLVVFCAILCLLSVFTVFTAFADDSYRTNVVLTIEETTQSSTEVQNLTPTDETTAVSATENITSTVTKSDSQFIKTGESNILNMVMIIFLIALAAVVLLITKRKYQTK